MTEKTFTICACIVSCIVLGALMFVPPISPTLDLVGGIGFWMWGFILGKTVE